MYRHQYYMLHRPKKRASKFSFAPLLIVVVFFFCDFFRAYFICTKEERKKNSHKNNHSKGTCEIMVIWELVCAVVVFFSGVFAWQQIAYIFFLIVIWTSVTITPYTNVNEPKFDWSSKYSLVFLFIQCWNIDNDSVKGTDTAPSWL